MERKALGKGLNALIEDGEDTGDLVELDIDLIVRNRQQPREDFDEESLEELADSIKINGVVQPVLVRPSGDEFELVYGERRWRAAQKAGLRKIPAQIRDISDERMLLLAVIENIQRKNLNPLEIARSFERLQTQLDLTQSDIAERVGRKRSSISNYQRLLSLPDEVKHLIEKEKISMGHAKAILGIDDEKQQIKAAEKAAGRELSVRDTEELIKKLKSSPEKEKKGEQKDKEKDVHTKKAEEKLQRKLGTRVRIKRTREGGKIKIDFHSEEDLNRLYDLILSIKMEN